MGIASRESFGIKSVITLIGYKEPIKDYLRIFANVNEEDVDYFCNYYRPYSDKGGLGEVCH